MTTAIHTGISEAGRTEVAHGLARVLADTYTLYLKTHKYHWNVVGPQFNSLHAMFETQYDELALAVDELAERIRALGEISPGSYREFSELTAIPEDTDHPNADGMVARLVDGHEQTARTIRDMFPAAETANDQASVDLLTRRLDVHEKTAWMLRSLLQ